MPGFAERLGVEGVGETASAARGERHSNRVRADDGGHVAPERCLAAHLFGDDELVHSEVSNTGFEDGAGRRVEAARAREEYGRLLDPWAAYPWVDGPASASGGVSASDDDDGGTASEEASCGLADDTFVFPALSTALEALGMDGREAETAAEGPRERRRKREASPSAVTSSDGRRGR